MIQVLSKEEMMNFFQTHSRYQIALATGISEQTLANYVKGRTDIGGMSFDKVIKITEYARELDEKRASKLNEVQLAIYSELSERVADGKLSYRDAVAVWEDERGIYSYSLDEKDLDNHDTVMTVGEAIKEILKSI